MRLPDPNLCTSDPALDPQRFTEVESAFLFKLAREVPTLRFLASSVDSRGSRCQRPLSADLHPQGELDDCDGLSRYDSFARVRTIGVGRCRWWRVVRGPGERELVLQEMADADGRRVWDFLNRATMQEIDSMDCELRSYTP